jgi:hypothetical protein
MSRTIRRTKYKHHHALFEKDYTYVRPDEWLGMKRNYYNASGFPLLKREGKEYIQAWHWFHSDNFNDQEAIFHWYGSKESAREQNKQELTKWLKNEEYEPMLQEHLNHRRYYDYW